MKYVFRYIRKISPFGDLETDWFAYSAPPSATLQRICDLKGRPTADRAISDELWVLNELINNACSVVVFESDQQHRYFTLVWDGLESEPTNDTD